MGAEGGSVGHVQERTQARDIRGPQRPDGALTPDLQTRAHHVKGTGIPPQSGVLSSARSAGLAGPLISPCSGFSISRKRFMTDLSYRLGRRNLVHSKYYSFIKEKCKGL